MKPVWLVVVAGLLTVAVRAEEPPLPRPQQGTPAQVTTPEHVPTLKPQPHDEARFRAQLDKLKAAREYLATQREQPVADKPPAPLDQDDELTKLRHRVNELMLRRMTGGLPDPMKPGPVPTVLPTTPTTSLPTKPEEKLAVSTTPALDALSLGNMLFQMGDFDGALRAFRQVDTSKMRVEESAPIIYLTACCLRRIGKLDEAAAKFREVAGMKGDEFLAECAQWQLANLRMRKDLEAKLQELRQRRQALEKEP
jgi:tetratricopeptide (TPR) repeat protein